MSKAKEVSVTSGDNEVVLHEIVNNLRLRVDWRSAIVSHTESRADGRGLRNGKEIKKSIVKSAPSIGIAGSQMVEFPRVWVSIGL